MAVIPEAIKYVAVIYKLSLFTAVTSEAIKYVAFIYKPSLTCRHLHADYSGTRLLAHVCFGPQHPSCNNKRCRQDKCVYYQRCRVFDLSKTHNILLDDTFCVSRNPFQVKPFVPVSASIL